MVHLRKTFKSLTFLGSLSLNLFSVIKIIAIVELKNLVRSLGYWLTFVALLVILFSCYFNISTKFSVDYTISPSSGLVNAEYTIPFPCASSFSSLFNNFYFYFNGIHEW